MVRIEDIIEKVEQNHPQSNVDVIRRAYLFSALNHRGQKRASGEPYLVHPLAVADILADMRSGRSYGFHRTPSRCSGRHFG